MIPLFTSPSGATTVRRAYQAVLDAWPVPYEEIVVPTRFGDTHVLASGPPDAPPVVLLHALMATSASWYRNVEALGRNYRVYAVDVVGEGNRSTSTAPIRSLDDFLAWFTEVINGLHVGALYLVGNSYGGFTAAYYAMKLPDRVRKLVLIGPAATIHSMWPFYVHMFVPKAVYQFLRFLPGARRAMRRAVRWMHQGLDPDPLWEPLFEATLVNAVLINQVMPRVYTGKELADIRAEVLFVFGSREAIYGDLDAAIRRARELVPDAQVAVLPDAHHVAAVAAPEAFDTAVLEFLAKPAELAA
jgi:pimeloyl-ACP methyl ester carboxylesterase